MSGLPQDRPAWAIAAIGVVALLLCAVFGWDEPAQAWVGYLAAYLFWLGLALGAMALAMIHALTGGTWGVLLRPQLGAAIRTLPLLALALLPLLFGADAMFPWMRADAAHDAQFARQAWYLNEPFLLGRAIVFMVLWLLLALGMVRHLDRALALGARPSESTAPASRRLLVPPALAIAGLVIYAVSATLFGVDWVAALEPRWHSSVFGLTFISLQLLGGLAVCVWFTLDPAARERLGARRPQSSELSERLGDLGTLLMVMLLACAYLVFMDYLTAWTGDLPSETVWYIPRTLTSWKWLAAWVIAFGLLLPFALLLSRRVKRSAIGLRRVAAMLLVAEVAFVWWLVLPSLRGAGLWFRPVDALAFIGLGALWWSVFAGALREPARRQGRQPAGAST
jgi:hypothetical protein